MRELDLGSITAYGDAKRAGFTGSYNDFCGILARLTAGMGVQSYVQLSNKPKINGVELVGNLTSDDLGLHTRGSRVEITTTSQELFGKTVTLTDGYETINGRFDNQGKCIFQSVLMSGTMIASATANGKTSYAYVKCPYFTNYKTKLTYTSNNVYSFIIDHSESLNGDSYAMVSYDDGASDFVPESDDLWLNEPFSLIKPCVVKNGSVLYYLNPNDYTKTIDGSVADITTLGNDVMVEFPRMGIRADWMDENRLKVSISVGNATEEGFDYRAFSALSNNDCDKIYIGAYLSYHDNGIPYSKSDTTPNTYRAGTVIENVGTKGDGYYLLGYSQYQLIQCLYILFCKTVNANKYGSDIRQNVLTGVTNKLGLNGNYFYGTNSFSSKLFGIEDITGSRYSPASLLTGFQYTGNRARISNFAEDKNGWNYFEEVNGIVINTSSARYNGIFLTNSIMTKPFGDSRFIFIPTEIGANTSTSLYYTDVDLYYGGIMEKGSFQDTTLVATGGVGPIIRRIGGTEYRPGTLFNIKQTSTTSNLFSRLLYMHKE